MMTTQSHVVYPPMVVGKQMQFFGARANLAKTFVIRNQRRYR